MDFGLQSLFTKVVYGFTNFFPNSLTGWLKKTEKIPESDTNEVIVSLPENDHLMEDVKMLDDLKPVVEGNLEQQSQPISLIGSKERARSPCRSGTSNSRDVTVIHKRKRRHSFSCKDESTQINMTASGFTVDENEVKQPKQIKLSDPVEQPFGDFIINAPSPLLDLTMTTENAKFSFESPSYSFADTELVLGFGSGNIYPETEIQALNANCKLIDFKKQQAKVFVCPHTSMYGNNPKRITCKESFERPTRQRQYSLLKQIKQRKEERFNRNLKPLNIKRRIDPEYKTFLARQNGRRNIFLASEAPTNTSYHTYQRNIPWQCIPVQKINNGQTTLNINSSSNSFAPASHFQQKNSDFLAGSRFNTWDFTPAVQMENTYYTTVMSPGTMNLQKALSPSSWSSITDNSSFNDGSGSYSPTNSYNSALSSDNGFSQMHTFHACGSFRTVMRPVNQKF